MKIDKISDLFEIKFKKPNWAELPELFKLCTKYHSRLFDDDFYNINLANAEKFIKFIRHFRNGIYCIMLGKKAKFGGFFYLYDGKRTPYGGIDTRVTFCISRPYWGFGSYLIAKKGIKFLFQELKVRKLSIEIVGENTLARNLIEKLGFEFEAVFKDECFKFNKPCNLYVFSMFNPAYCVAGQ